MTYKHFQDLVYILFVVYTLGMWMIWGAARVKFEWRDIWLGVFIGKDALYICFVPCIVFIFPKKEPTPNAMTHGYSDLGGYEPYEGPRGKLIHVRKKKV